MYKLQNQGKTSDGKEIFTLISLEDNSVKKVSRDQLVFLVGKGEVEGPTGVLSGQLYQGKVIVRGIGRGGSGDITVDTHVTTQAEIKAAQALVPSYEPKKINKKASTDRLHELTDLFKSVMGDINFKLFVKADSELLEDGGAVVHYHYLHKDNEWTRVSLKYEEEKYYCEFTFGRTGKNLKNESQAQLVHFLKGVKRALILENLMQENPSIELYKIITNNLKKELKRIDIPNKMLKGAAVTYLAAITITHESVLSEATRQGLKREHLSKPEWIVDFDDDGDILMEMNVPMFKNAGLGLTMSMWVDQNKISASGWADVSDDPFTYTGAYSVKEAYKCMYSVYRDLIDTGIMRKV